MDEIDPIDAMFKLRYRRVFDLYFGGKHKEAETGAQELLMGPQLSPFHQAGMHFILCACPHNYVKHGEKAVALYEEMLRDEDNTAEDNTRLGRLLAKSQLLLEKARQDYDEISRRRREKLASIITMGQVHEAQIDAIRDSLDEAHIGVGGTTPVLESQAASQSQSQVGSQTDSQSAPSLVSSQARPATTSKQTGNGMDIDDSQPLPEVVRYDLPKDDGSKK